MLLDNAFEILAEAKIRRFFEEKRARGFFLVFLFSNLLYNILWLVACLDVSNTLLFLILLSFYSGEVLLHSL
jgi:hypothetical protein